MSSLFYTLNTITWHTWTAQQLPANYKVPRMRQCSHNAVLESRKPMGHVPLQIWRWSLCIFLLFFHILINCYVLFIIKFVYLWKFLMPLWSLHYYFCCLDCCSKKSENLLGKKFVPVKFSYLEFQNFSYDSCSPPPPPPSWILSSDYYTIIMSDYWKLVKISILA